MDAATLKKMAAEEQGRRFFETPAPPVVPELNAVDLAKVASADRVLLNIATFLRPADPLGMYEELGGNYSRK